MKSFSKKRPLSGEDALFRRQVRIGCRRSAWRARTPIDVRLRLRLRLRYDTMQDARAGVAATRHAVLPILNKSDKTKTANSPSCSLSMRQLRGTHTHTQR